MTKDELRAAALVARADVDEPALRAASACAHLRGWLAREAPRAVLAGYHPIRGEIDPRPVLAAHSGPTALPVTEGFRRPLSFRAWHLGQSLVPGPFGTLHPPQTAPAVVPEVVIVPLAGFDTRGTRIGYGGGYYDRTLAALRATGAVFAVGLAYAVQQVEAVPEEPFDQPLDLIVTEDGLIWPSRD